MIRRPRPRARQLLQIEAGIVRFRDTADRLVRTPSVQQKIQLIAAALFKHGTLSGASR